MNEKSDVKQFLEQALVLSKQLALKKQQLAELENLEKSVSISPAANTAAQAQIDILRDNYVREITRLLVIKYEIGEKIAAVPDDNCRMVLEARYVSCMKWEQVAELMYFSLMHVHRLAREGIAMLSL